MKHNQWYWHHNSASDSTFACIDVRRAEIVGDAFFDCNPAIGNVYGSDIEECERNAKLICSAPDMLKTLKLAKHKLTQGANVKMVIDLLDQAIKNTKV